MRHLIRAFLSCALLACVAADAQGQRKGRPQRPPESQEDPSAELLTLVAPERLHHSRMFGRASASFYESRVVAEVGLVALEGGRRNRFDMKASFVVNGATLKEPKTVKLVFVPLNGGALRANALPLTAEADGTRHDLGLAKRTEEGEAPVEFHSRINFQLYKALADGKQVRLRLGSAVVTLGPAELVALRDLYGIIGTEPPGRKF